MNKLLEIYYRLRYRKGEWFEIVDNDGNVTGQAPRSVCHDGRSFYLHRVVHLLIVNRKGELLLQKRSMEKDIQPGKWDTAVGGHINIGEKVSDAVRRETLEELGIQLEPQQVAFLHSYLMESDREKELVHTFLVVRNDKSFAFSKEEISEVRYWPLASILKNIGKGIFTPNFEDEFRRFLHRKKKRKK